LSKTHLSLLFYLGFTNLYHEFPRAISDPVLGIRTFQYLEAMQHPHWMGYLKERGAADRLLDLFVPFMSPLYGNYEKNVWQFRLDLCDLLVSLIVNHTAQIALIDEFQGAVYRQIVAMMADAPPEIAINFFRRAVRLNQKTLEMISNDLGNKRILNLLRAAPRTNAAHAAVIKYVIKIQRIPVEQLANILLDQPIRSTWDLEVLTSIALRFMGAQLLIIRYLATIRFPLAYVLYSSVSMMSKA
jgi:hypothetical protein